MAAQRSKSTPASETKMPSIVCVVVHPSHIFCEGLKTTLANSPFAPACTAPSIDDVPSAIVSAGEQVLVLIGVRDACNLAETLGVAKASFPDADTVVIGDSGNRELVTTALELGATSFIDENVTTSGLVKQLELVVQGEPVISVVLIKRLRGQGSAQSSDQAVKPLTLDQRHPPEPEDEDEDDEAGPDRRLSGREAAILNALVQGKSNKVIAYQLSITEATVKVHVKAILRKTRLKNRTQAAIWALHHPALSKVLHAANGDSPVDDGQAAGCDPNARSSKNGPDTWGSGPC